MSYLYHLFVFCCYQLEDAEFAAMKAQKAKAKLEEDIKDLQGQYDAISKGKMEVNLKLFLLCFQNSNLSNFMKIFC